MDVSCLCLFLVVNSKQVVYCLGSFIFLDPGYPEPGKTTVFDESQTIELENIDLNGGFLVKMLYLSVDPYFRARMREPQIKSYLVSSFSRANRIY